jgi:hypothetical protein
VVPVLTPESVPNSRAVTEELAIFPDALVTTADEAVKDASLFGEIFAVLSMLLLVIRDHTKLPEPFSFSTALEPDVVEISATFAVVCVGLPTIESALL